MTAENRQHQADKADRALELHDKGLGIQAIAERLSVKPTNVAGMLQRAKQRRKAKEAAE